MFYDRVYMSEPEVLADDDAPPKESISRVNPGPSNVQTRSAGTGSKRPVPTNTSAKTLKKGQIQGRTTVNKSTSILPAEKVFPIQVGTELFRLSGASITSDGPSYFTQFFEEQIRQNEDSGGVRTLYIDRDPNTFRDIARHLQGYFIKPTNGEHFVKLFADAQFYSLPRFIIQLFESEIFIQIGEKHFQIPKDIFSDPGNSPNFFSLGFAVFFSTPNDVFPGLDKRGLLRPPPINPPYVPGRSSEIFAQLLHMLKGYPLHIRDETHRADLLRDCKYFHLRGLEQRIIAHSITYNLKRRKTEICLGLDDIKPSGISYQPDEIDPPSNVGGWVYYSRPFVDETSYELVVEIRGESTMLYLGDMRAEFHGTSKRRVASLLQIVANKMNLPASIPLGLVMLSGGTPSPSSSPGMSPLSEDRVKILFDSSTSVTLDNSPFDVNRLLAVPASKSPYDGHSDSVQAVHDYDMGSEAQYGQGNEAMDFPVPAPTVHNSAISEAMSTPSQPPSKKRKLDISLQTMETWTIKRGQWRLRVQPTLDPARSGYEAVLIGVKLDAYSNERARNAQRDFLV